MNARTTIYSKTGPFVPGHKPVRDRLTRVPGPAAGATDYSACVDLLEAFVELHHYPIPVVGTIKRASQA